MGKHYQIVNEDIVFNVMDEEIVLKELKEALDSAYENYRGGHSVKFLVEIIEELPDPENGGNDIYTTLCISDPDSGLIIDYTAKDPVLVNVDGKFCHYWDFVLSSHTMTSDPYDEENDVTIGNPEEAVIKAIEDSVNQ